MYHEPNLGIYRGCAVCGHRYWCDDGSPVCNSQECQRIALAPRCQNCEEVMEDETLSELCDNCETHDDE